MIHWVASEHVEGCCGDGRVKVARHRVTSQSQPDAQPVEVMRLGLVLRIFWGHIVVQHPEQAEQQKYSNWDADLDNCSSHCQAHMAVMVLKDTVKTDNLQHTPSQSGLLWILHLPHWAGAPSMSKIGHVRGICMTLRHMLQVLDTMLVI